MSTRRFLNASVGARRVVGLAILVLAPFVGFAGLLSGQELIPLSLQGRWQLETLGDRAVDTPRPVYFEINGTTIVGFDGCNTFGGPLGTPARIRVGQRGCVGENVVLPLDLANPVGQLRNGRLAGDILTLQLPDGMSTATLRRDVRD